MNNLLNKFWWPRLWFQIQVLNQTRNQLQKRCDNLSAAINASHKHAGRLSAEVGKLRSQARKTPEEEEILKIAIALANMRSCTVTWWKAIEDNKAAVNKLEEKNAKQTKT